MQAAVYMEEGLAEALGRALQWLAPCKFSQAAEAPEAHLANKARSTKTTEVREAWGTF